MRIFALVAALLLTLAAPASAAPLSLLKPTGHYPIGLRTMALTDPARADHWRPQERRTLMVSLWYPAIPVGEPGRYMTRAESAVTVKQYGLPEDTLYRLRTHSRADAPALPSARGWPLVVLSPGAGNSRTTLTTLAEQLASQGFVVAAIDHAYEAFNVEFPGGRMLTCLPCAAEGNPWPAGIESRAGDVSFVLDSLLGQRSPHIDRERIGMAGHSAGGAAAALAMAADRRIKAAIDLDGPFYRPVALDRPFALYTSPVGEEEFGAGWDENWPRLTGWKQRRFLPETGHSSSTDTGYLITETGLKDKVPATTWSRLYGSIDPAAGLRFFRDELTDFFEDKVGA
ncbi:alpha/beta hydrolase family protein [Amycolatopsis sp. cg5]|uniref:alpha/beta hydrolase family protein n=1 Tax=Amycolatopsis sp. cg5 TaxID=3238802 RepID=UPI003525438E